ncbi:MAG: glucose-6-phosphate dehydrogenase [Candidatus Wildermuthbacteria bacterium]|nr:glucose-6-phosphate dehydrogenase [Candidatus Wildermuthbacteria bacterium]
MPSVFVIFGATGDLMRRKLAPALFRLYQKKMLPPLFQIVGFSRRELTNEEFRKEVQTILEQYAPTAKEQIREFVRSLLYQQGLFERRKGYKDLAQLLGMRDREWRVCSNKLFYLAVPPQYYKTIFRNLAASGLTVPCGPEEGWTRVIVEKPFGKNLRTAQELDHLLGKLFKEEQIYRIDHYLGKETVQNVLAFRFSNSFLQDSWHKDAIEQISIHLLEQEGVEERGFYEGVGALRDVGQNHILQLLALFTMENPGSFDAVSIRKKRAEVLQSLEKVTPKMLAQRTIRGQYEGYRKEKGISSQSQTETYFRIKTFLHVPRWRGVPFILESGKKLDEEKVEVVVTFKHLTPCLCPPGAHSQNMLRYIIQPQERVDISFWVKKPGAEMIIQEKSFTFDYRKAFETEEFSDAYERLLWSVINGDQTLFVSTDEIVASWKFIDPVVRAWQKNRVALLTYPQNSPAVRQIDFGVTQFPNNNQPQ